MRKKEKRNLGSAKRTSTSQKLSAKVTVPNFRISPSTPGRDGHATSLQRMVNLIPSSETFKATRCQGKTPSTAVGGRGIAARRHEEVKKTRRGRSACESTVPCCGLAASCFGQGHHGSSAERKRGSCQLSIEVSSCMLRKGQKRRGGSRE